MAALARAPLALARRLPKVELHVHLDGSIQAGSAPALDASSLGPAAFGRQVRRRDRSSMSASLKVFDRLVAGLQSASSLRNAASSVCDQLWREGVVWAEIRFCPALHTQRGLTPADALLAVKEGVAASKLPHSAVIACALRSMGSGHAERMVDAALEAGAHGFDVAGNEQDFPLEAAAGAAMRRAAAAGLGVTAHAGEWPGTGSNVFAALSAGASRIGHGIAVGGDAALVQAVIEAGATVECCPTANVGSGRAPSFSAHPIAALMRAGVKVSVSCDNLLASGSAETGPATPTGEVCRLLLPRSGAGPGEGGMGMSPAEVGRALSCGAAAAFGAPEQHRLAAVAALEQRGRGPAALALLSRIRSPGAARDGPGLGGSVLALAVEALTADAVSEVEQGGR
ncbi:hypothetical protein FNF27_00819 [Cafeteria roenbergensis]|uniref:adenosine deaminase n=1 Tax=Cafeteria roenbergensis TaxID=33653 RepID=A0A5A8DJE2_CAFRO|nr:hypothetical protein FNF28_03383 [Cafeteria roenbergensis]KAA0168378.1 hypothetical protein FNF31_00260 [Cafeteria roenbergensis]KAA0177646.1 hypothetical protein FNF27_00819 [Cafeteria roenbergensis]